ncbi:Nif3-like dinuclear metal center hexameric protein [Candidatus Woesebacteria bacterium RIFCSPHIGHO2_01_FULL_38_9]|uniref:Nif3-like dinuclear metal center hexameric protein n=2 Tax=Candidatus Woeseibacteriota TaxID=1752722 RepID=A0A1F7Y148_9BACT|nr:MAG: Nif3-like dinuclear metal center hexameric protein [Candidatus Woesebacteria bacterium RIFCSPHIGHO2_01_FULL_38_9]OGM58881.1 MAG: Nif3-like dinuclear metal center hexameric protein [Candidatus Woesebacteria bacterium RIFCSPLOWO2_01_FULL_39_10]
MIKRDELIDFINQTIGKELISKALQKDEMLNGIQFLGGENVEKVALGVSLNEEFLQEAEKFGSNFCIFHHGFDVRTWKSRYPTYSQKRLRLIFKNDITVMGFHYALDAHPKIGNNAQIVKKLGANIKEPLFDEWGYTATFEKSQDIHDLAEKCQKIFNHEVFVVENGPHKVKKIGVVSGGAKPYEAEVAEMEEKGVELFLSGETSESTPYKMKEAKINYFVCGHYATEKFGVQELGKSIESKFNGKINVKFIEVENPI